MKNGGPDRLPFFMYLSRSRKPPDEKEDDTDDEPDQELHMTLFGFFINRIRCDKRPNQYYGNRHPCPKAHNILSFLYFIKSIH